MNHQRSDFARPPADEVIVWQLSLSLPPEDFARCRAVLSGEEQRRAQRLFQPVRRRYIACWGQVRWLLGACLDLAPASIEFVRGQWGKPYLLGACGLAFNLSHSQDRMLLAVGRDRALGVDVEVIRPLANLERLARRCLAPSEWDAWRNLPEGERVRAFFRFWTLKEALAKACGRGLGLGIQHCAFALGAAGASLLTVPKACAPAASWTVYELGGGGEVCAALCARPGSFRVRERRLPADWISATFDRGKVRKSGSGAQARPGVLERTKGQGQPENSGALSKASEPEGDRMDSRS